MQKVNKTTGDRTLDEDLRRLYKRGDDVDTAIAALQKASNASTSPNPSPISPLPGIAPGGPPLPVAANAVSGTSTAYSPSDHVHHGVQSFQGSVVIAAPSATLAITHNLALNTPFLASVQVYSSAGVQQTTAGATFVFTTNSVTITFLAALAADTYSVLALG
jgi:hypothetical protein